MSPGLHINLDDAWDSPALPMASLDARPLGPHLRYTAPQAQIERAYAVFKEALVGQSLILYGSGDYHYLAAWWLRAALERHPAARDLTLISFDNHPDWDIRPPRWACGGWVNRALEFPQVARVAVWGCGNFELAWPARLFRNRRALAAGRLAIHAWAERQSPRTARRFDCMTRDTWRDRFTAFARTLAGQPFYITIDLDSLAADYALTNWENGLFTPDDLVWALGQLQASATAPSAGHGGGGGLLGADCCGAFSTPLYARRGQRWAGRFDHPRLTRPTGEAQRINHQTLATLWPALTRITAPQSPGIV